MHAISTGRALILCGVLSCVTLASRGAAEVATRRANQKGACLNDSSAKQEALSYLRDFLDSSATQPENRKLKVMAGLLTASFAKSVVVTDAPTCRRAINAFGSSLAKSVEARATYLASDPAALVVRVRPNRILVADGSSMYDGRPLWVVFDSIFTLVLAGI